VKPAIPERPPWLLGWFDTYGYILLVGMANEELAAAAAAAAAAATELAADADTDADADPGELSLRLRCSDELPDAEGDGEQLLSPACELPADGGVSSSCWWAWAWPCEATAAAASLLM